MSLHISATTGCNLGCTYCYENPERERKQEWVDRQYDMDDIIEKLDDWREVYPNNPPGMHGGEPLLVRKEDLETIFEYVNEHWPDQGSHIQTNGTLMDEEHIEIFKEHNVHVGISCDGPKELNRLRKAAGERDADQTAVTDSSTEKTHEAIEMVIDSEVSLGIITVLSEQNAGTDEKFETLLDWIDDLNQDGVHGHFNPAIPYEEVSPDEDVALSRERLKECFVRAWKWMNEEEYREWGPMNEYKDNLLGTQLSDCVNNKCDVANAGAARIIMGDGETTGCGKTWAQYGDGEAFLQGDSNNSQYDQDTERYQVLKETPGAVTEDMPDMGGCKGCKYWKVCQGGCPGAGQGDDYRKRSHFCQAKYALYEEIESDLRNMFPNIRLVTDLPWDAEVSDAANTWNLDIKPFAAMRPGIEGKSSTSGGFNHNFGSVEDCVPDDILPEKPFDEQVREAREQYSEDILEIDKENYYIHADSNNWEQESGE